jgi:hypothetical protein
MNNYLKPCLISVFKNTKDDYKLKTINTEVNILFYFRFSDY